MKTKRCTRCKVEKAIVDFGVAKDERRKTAGVKSWCKRCESEYQKTIYANNPQKQRERRALYLSRYRDKYNASRKKNRLAIYISESARKYKATKEQIQNLLSVGCCEICGGNNRLSIDHCHKANRVRGLLCDCCNNLLGRCRDNTDILRKAMRYLNERK